MSDTITFETHQEIVDSLYCKMRGLIIENGKLRLAATLATEVIAQHPEPSKVEQDALALLRKTLETPG